MSAIRADPGLARNEPGRDDYGQSNKADGAAYPPHRALVIVRMWIVIGGPAARQPEHKRDHDDDCDDRFIPPE